MVGENTKWLHTRFPAGNLGSYKSIKKKMKKVKNL